MFSKKWSAEERNAYHRQWRAKNKAKRSETAKKWRAKHGAKYDAGKRVKTAENTAKLQAAKRKWERENPEKVRDQQIRRALRAMQVKLANHLRFHYQITIEDYKALLIRQNGQCAICLRDKGNDRGHRLHIDHDHATGLVRGLLCSRCNSAIGYFDEQPVRLRRAASYIEKWRGVINSDRTRVQPVLGGLSVQGGEVRGEEGIPEGPEEGDGG